MFHVLFFHEKCKVESHFFLELGKRRRMRFYTWRNARNGRIFFLLKTNSLMDRFFREIDHAIISGAANVETDNT